MLGLVGETDIDTSITGVTVSVVDPDMLPDAAVTEAEPADTEEASPDELIFAAAVLEEFQLTCVVMSCVVSSENVPMAVNCWTVPSAMLALEGVTVRDSRVALVTVIVVEPE
jgi:hypothetical protein